MDARLIVPVTLGSIGASTIAIRWFIVRKRVSPWTLAAAPLCVAYVFFRAWIFGRSGPPTPTFDLYLLYADRAYGFQPSLVASHWVEHLHLFPLISIVYESLMLSIAVAYAYALDKRIALRTFAVMVLTPVLSLQAYRLLPACGPVWLLGSECYLGEVPASCAQVSQANLQPIQLSPTFPRNAMPSMHIAWALLVYWTFRKSRARQAALAFLLLTALATLGGGEHYLVDLVGAFPYALAIWVTCSGKLNAERALAIAASVLTLLAWIGAIRFAPELLHANPAVPWLLSAAIIGGVIVFQRREEGFTVESLPSYSCSDPITR